MEVTCKNFEDILAEVEQSIETCSFIAIDTELSGLNVTDEKDNLFETVEERYHVVKNSASQFLILQFGLCPFFYNKEKNEFTHKCFNFYTFPRQCSTNAPNIRFLCESSSLDFLASYGFNFNKLIYEGIPYLTFSNEAKMQEDCEKKSALLNSEENSSPIQIPESLKSFMTSTENKIKDFIRSDEVEMKVENVTPFQRKLIFNNIKPKYSKNLYFESILANEQEKSISESDKSDSDGVTPVPRRRSPPTVNDKKEDGKSKEKNNFQPPKPKDRTRILRIVKLTVAQQNERIAEKKKNEMEVISKAIGFSRVIRKISQSGKIVVGHNMLLDVSHSIHQFVDPLPDNLSEFKIMVQNSFPNLVDTKYMSATHPFKDLITSSVLGDLFKKVQEKPFDLPKICQEKGKIKKGYDLSDQKLHEAGYDAFITGVSFLGMCQYLGTLQVPKQLRVFPDSPLIMPFLNKLFLMRMLDITYLNISGTDLTPSRSHVFYVTCPKDASVKSINEIFNPFGNIQIWWLNSTSLFVSLSDKGQSNLVMNNIDCEPGSLFKVIPFEQYQKIQAEKKRPLLSESPERPNEVIKLPASKISHLNEQMNKRPKTEPRKKQLFEEPASWN